VDRADERRIEVGEPRPQHLCAPCVVHRGALDFTQDVFADPEAQLARGTPA